MDRDRELEPREWRTVLEDVEKRHNGTLVRVEVGDDDGRERLICEDVPLQELDLDVNGRIVIVAGEGEARVSHSVDEPTELALHYEEHWLSRMVIGHEDDTETRVTFIPRG